MIIYLFSYLEDHFHDDLYESGRADDLKRLKSCAFLTEFVLKKSNPTLCKPPRKRQLTIKESNEHHAKRIRVERCYAKSSELAAQHEPVYFLSKDCS